jgi:radical SAM protein with 4Fe4S-binding SPASM domain
MRNHAIDTRGWEAAKAGDIHVMMEITDYCNCKCIMCKQSQSDTMHRENKKQFLDLGLFIKLIEDLREKGPRGISFDPVWVGESTIHPDFKEMLYYLFETDKAHDLLKGFVINTNAIAMDSEMVDIFLNYAKYIRNREGHFMRLYFSLDAIKEETYSKIKNVNGENLKKAMKNINYVIKKRREMNLVFPNLTFGFIVMNENVEEALDFVEYWKRHLSEMSHVPVEVAVSDSCPVDRDLIYLRQVVGFGDEQEAIRLHKSVAKSLEMHLGKDVQVSIKYSRPPCGALWRTPNIAVNGDVLPCCRDDQLTMVLGNIKKESLHDIWHGEKITQLRLAHINKEFSVPFETFPTCLNCVNSEGGTLSNEDILEYLQSVGREELMVRYLERKKLEKNL